ncbi:uncharacterized protein METZ01_LOCUS254653, partial [marine metagenome]
FVLEGWGSMLIDGAMHSLAEGDTVHIAPGLRHQIMNDDCNGWLSYLVIS